MQITGHRPQANPPIPASVGRHDHNTVKAKDGEVAVKLAISPSGVKALNYSDFLKKFPERVKALEKILDESRQEEAPISGPFSKQAYANLPGVIQRLVELNRGLNDIAECADIKRLLEEHVLRAQTIERQVEPEIIQFRLNNFCDACEWLKRMPQPMVREVCYEWLSNFLGVYHYTFGGTSNVQRAFAALEDAVFSPASLLQLCARLCLLPAASKRAITERLLDTIELQERDNDEFRAAILLHLAESPYVPPKMNDIMGEEFQHFELLFQRQISCAMLLPNHLRFPLLTALNKALRDPDFFKVAPALQRSMRLLDDRCNIDQMEVIHDECQSIAKSRRLASELEIENLCKMMAPMSARYVPVALGKIFRLVKPIMRDVLLFAIVGYLSAQNRLQGVLWLAKAVSSSPDFDARPTLHATDLGQLMTLPRGLDSDLSGLLKCIRDDFWGDKWREYTLWRLGASTVCIAIDERVSFLRVLLNAASSPQCFAAIAASLQHVEPKARFDLASPLMKAIENLPSTADEDIGEVCHYIAQFYSKPSADDKREFLRCVSNLGVHLVYRNIEENKARDVFVALYGSLHEYHEDATLQGNLKNEIDKIKHSLEVKFPRYTTIGI